MLMRIPSPPAPRKFSGGRTIVDGAAMDDADRARKKQWQAADRQARRLAIAWNGQVVGWLDDARSDMPFTYGRWVGANDAIAREFLAALRRAVDAGEGVEVTLGAGSAAVIYVHPDDNGGVIDVR
jgi:hypothetical protein